MVYTNEHGMLVSSVQGFSIAVCVGVTNLLPSVQGITTGLRLASMAITVITGALLMVLLAIRVLRSWREYKRDSKK